MKTKIWIYLAAMLLGTSCASSYKNMDTAKQNYVNKQRIAGHMEIGYKYDIYANSLNKKYARKEKNYGYKTIAVEIKNLSSIPILLTEENFKVYAGQMHVQPANMNIYFSNVKQTSGAYLLHGLWGPWRVETWSDSYGNSGGKVTYLPIGLAIGVINALVAGNANKKHYANIQYLNVYGKTIEPNQTLHGVMCLKYLDFDVLTFNYLGLTQ